MKPFIHCGNSGFECNVHFIDETHFDWEKLRHFLAVAREGRLADAIIGVRKHRPDQIGLAGRHTSKIRFAVYATDEDVYTWASVTGKAPSVQFVRDNSDQLPRIEVSNALCNGHGSDGCC